MGPSEEKKKKNPNRFMVEILKVEICKYQS